MGWNLRYSDRGRAKLLEDRDVEKVDTKAARKRRRYARRMDETTEGLDAAGDAIREWLARRGN